MRKGVEVTRPSERRSSIPTELDLSNDVEVAISYLLAIQKGEYGLRSHGGFIEIIDEKKEVVFFASIRDFESLMDAVQSAALHREVLSRYEN